MEAELRAGWQLSRPAVAEAWAGMRGGGGETGSDSGSVLKGVSTGLQAWDLDAREKGIYHSCLVLGPHT